MSNIKKTLADFKLEFENPSEAFTEYISYLASLPKPKFVKN